MPTVNSPSPRPSRACRPRLETLDRRTLLSATPAALSAGVSFPLELIDGTTRSATLPQFDPALGRLFGVDIAASAQLAGSATLENFTDAPSTASLTMGGSFVVSTASFAAPLTGFSNIQLDDIALPPFDGDLDFDGPGAVFLGPDSLARAASVSRSLASAADDLAAFLGTGTIDVAFTPAGTAELNENNGNILVATELSAGAQVTVRYLYVPFSLSGFVYGDCPNPNGLRDPGEQGIAGVTLSLTGQTSDGQSVGPLTAVTDSSGFYQFTGLKAGRYTVVETQPVGLFDGPETRGNVTPLPNSIGADTIADIAVGGDILAAEQSNFGEYGPATISGYVYLDANNNGLRDPDETGIGNVTLTLEGTNDLGQSVTPVAVTNGEGFYQFANLRPGSYTIHEAQPSPATNAMPPANYLDGFDTQGNIVAISGSIGADTIGPVVVGLCGQSVENNFGERLPAAESQVLATPHVFGIHSQRTLVVLTFSLPLDPARAQNVAHYRILAPGPDGRFGTADDDRIPIAAATYDASSQTVTLEPRVRLALGRDFQIAIKGPNGLLPTGQGLVNLTGQTGDYVVIVQRGTSVSYSDIDGDRVNIKSSRGGLIELLRSPDGQARRLYVLPLNNHGPKLLANKSWLKGKVRRLAGGNGRAVIPSVIAPVRIKLLWNRKQFAPAPLSIAALPTAELPA